MNKWWLFVVFAVGTLFGLCVGLTNMEKRVSEKFSVYDIKSPYEGYYYATFNVIVRELDKKDGLEDDYQKLADEYEQMWLRFRDMNEQLEELGNKETRKPSKELLERAQTETNKRMEKWFK